MALNAADVRAYAAKAEEYLEAAEDALFSGRYNADLLEASGKDGKDASKHLARLIPLKTKAEYDPGNVPRSKAETAVKSASRMVESARRLLN